MDSRASRPGPALGLAKAASSGRMIEEALYHVGTRVASVIDRLEEILRRAGGENGPSDDMSSPNHGLLGQAQNLDNMLGRIEYVLADIEKHV